MHDSFIKHCLDLASKGRGLVGNGAMVGSCLVRNNTVIAEGYHAEFGSSHAERDLLEGLQTEVLQDDILYVNLEPCCHYGKTPPCTDIIIDSGVENVVFGMLDPDPRVAGQGVKILIEAGIQVVGPISSTMCRRFNKGYVSLRSNNRPWVTLKKASLATGEISNPDGSPLKITSKIQDAWSHTYLRSTHDAIVVGVQTIFSDNPLLTIRHGDGLYQPKVVVLDPKLRTPIDSKIVREGTIILTSDEVQEVQKIEILKTKGVHCMLLKLKDNLRFDLPELLQKLCSPKDSYSGLSSLLIEGGATTWEEFMNAQLYDEQILLTKSVDK